MTRGKWQLAIVIAIALPRILLAALSDATIVPDSERYRGVADTLATFQAWDGYGPGFLTQLVNLLPLTAAMVLQVILVTILWGAAALYAADLASNARRSWITFIVIQAWSLSPWFALWDTWVLTEALTMAGCALTAVGVAAVRYSARHSHWVAIAGLAVALATRPFVGAMLLPIVALVLAWPARRDRLSSLARPLFAGALIALFATWQVLAFASTDDAPFSYLAEPESLAQVQATDRFAGRSHLPGYLDLARDADMPPCPAAVAIAEAPLNFEKLDQLRAINNCPEFDQWLGSGGLPWTHEFTHNTSVTVGELVQPSYWIRDPFIGYAALDDRYRNLSEAVGAGWEDLAMAINMVMLAATAIATCIALVLCRGQRLFLMAAICVVSAVTVYAWGVDGIEYWRHVLAAFAFLPPLAVALTAGTRSAR